MFGYGYAVAVEQSLIAAATTISIFNGATPLGTLSYDGCARIPSSAGDSPESRAPSRSTASSSRSILWPHLRLPLDNIRASAFVAISEPTPILLVLIALVAFLWMRPRERSAR